LEIRVDLMTNKKPMPKFTKAPPELVATFERATAGLPQIEHRKMFGYPAVFAGGQMFSGLFQDSMIVRLSAEDRAAFADQFEARPFEPIPGRPMREYLAVPEAILSSPKRLGEWLEKARSYAASLPAKGKRAKKKAGDRKKR
jgi:TfoX/Sxy family transcriptional regulator of competence genes